MTASPDDGSMLPTVRPIAELFTGAATGLWATTYTIDLGLFNEFFLPRLGELPLNVAVLADQRRLTASLDRIPAERADTLAAVNRRWLLRGVPAGGASSQVVPSGHGQWNDAAGRIRQPVGKRSGRRPGAFYDLPGRYSRWQCGYRCLAVMDAPPGQPGV